ncbi:phage DNA encapsidation protein, partial [Herbiconiux daphne]
MKFYSPKRIGQRKAQYNVVFGERSNGKTTALLKQAIKNYFSTENGDYTRQQFAYIRRWDTDIKAKRMKQMFGYINSTGLVSEISNGEFDHVHFYNGVFYFAKYDGEGKSIYSPIDCLGHAFALNMMEHDKGSSYPLVTLIVFDEFIARRIYLTDEFVLLMNVISTIIRLRTNVSIWLLGNTVNKYCPYFAEFGLKNVDEMKQGTIDVYRYGDSPLKLACEYCADNSESKPNSHLFAFDNPKLNMIAGGSWELSIFPHAPMKWKPKN